MPVMTQCPMRHNGTFDLQVIKNTTFEKFNSSLSALMNSPFYDDLFQQDRFGKHNRTMLVRNKRKPIDAGAPALLTVHEEE